MPSPAPARARWAVLTVAVLATFLVNMDEAAVPVATPRIGDALGASLAELQWVYAGFLLPLAALLVTGGALADRLGSRRVLVAGLLVFVAGSAASAATSSPGPLVAMRVIEGVGAAFVLPASLAVLRSAFAGPALARAIGTWVAGAIGGAAAGPLLAGALLAAFSWRSVFAPNVILGAVVVVLALVALPPGVRSPAELRWRWNLVLAAGLVALVWGLINAGSHGWGSGRVLPAIVAGPLALAALGAVVWRRAAASPAVDAGALAAGLGLTQLSLFAAVGPFFLLLIWFQRVLELSPLRAGIYVLPLSGIAAGLSPLWGRWVGRHGTALLLPVAFVAEVAGLAGLSTIDGGSSYASIVPFLLLIGLAMGALSTCTISLIVRSVPPERGGAVSGTHGAAVHVGNSLAVAVAGSVVAASVAGEYSGALRRAGLPQTPALLSAAKADLAQGIAGSGAFRRPGVDAFTLAMGHAVLVSACVAGVGLACAVAYSLRGRLPFRPVRTLAPKEAP